MTRVLRRRRTLVSTAALGLVLLGACSVEDSPPDTETSAATGPADSAATTGDIGTRSADDTSTATAPDTSAGTQTPADGEESAAADGDEGAAESTATAEPTVVEELAVTTPPEEVAEEDDADPLVTPYIEVSAEALAAPEDPDVDALTTVATGVALEGLQAQQLMFAESGLVLVGSPTVVSAVVQSVDREAEPPTAVVEVCLDQTDVDVMTTDGESVVDQSAPRRGLTTLTIQFVDERWVLAKQTFPVDTDC